MSSEMNICRSHNEDWIVFNSDTTHNPLTRRQRYDGKTEAETAYWNEALQIM